MLHSICVSSNKLFVPWVAHNYLNISIFDYCMNEKDDSAFVEKLRAKKILSTSERFLGIVSIGESITGLKSVFFILQNAHLEVLLFKFIENFTDYSQVANIKIPEINITEKNIFVIDGPVVLFVSNINAGIYSLPYRRGKLYNLRALTDIDLCFHNILQFSNACKFSTGTNEFAVFFLVLLLIDKSNNKLICISTIIQNVNTGQFYEKMFNIPSHTFVPVCYHQIATSVFINLLNLPGNTLGNDNLKENVLSLPWRENKTYVCTEKQFLVFYRGCLKSCCDIPFGDVNRIILGSNVNSHSDETKMLLQSSAKGVCCVKISSSEKAMCAYVWEEATKAIICDFLGRGSTQLLLLFDTHHEKFQENCVLIDLGTLIPIVMPNDDDDSQDEYLKNTVIGLQKRVLAGKAAVVNAHRQIAQKTVAIKDAIHRINKHETSLECPEIDSLQKHLFDIILHKDENKHYCDKSCSEAEITLKIIDHWKMLLPRHWVIGWTFQNISDRCVTVPSIIVFAEKTPLQCNQRVYIHSKLNTWLTKNDCKHLIPGEILSVATCLEMPIFVADKFEISCTVSWYIGTTDELTNDLLSFDEKIKLPHQQVPIQTYLSVNEVLGECKELSFEHQLMSYRSFQESFIIHISCIVSDLSNLLEMIKKQSGVLVCISENDRKCLLINDKASSLYGTNMAWNQLNKMSVEAEIFVRDKQEGLLFLQWLRNLLPDDISVTPYQYLKSEEKHIQKKLLTAMKDELDLLNAVFAGSSTETSDEDKLNVKTEKLESGTVKLSAEDYYRVRNALSKRELITDSIVKNMLLHDTQNI